MNISLRLVAIVVLMVSSGLSGCGARYESETDTIKEIESYGNLLELEDASRANEHTPKK